MFLWTYRQVIAFFLLLVIFGIALARADTRFAFWVNRAFPFLFFVVALLALRYVVRK
ncbi:MAG: hypothetical protein ACE145_05725 [Terriglobia bacterium]